MHEKILGPESFLAFTNKVSYGEKNNEQIITGEEL